MPATPPRSSAVTSFPAIPQRRPPALRPVAAQGKPGVADVVSSLCESRLLRARAQAGPAETFDRLGGWVRRADVWPSATYGNTDGAAAQRGWHLGFYSCHEIPPESCHKFRAD